MEPRMSLFDNLLQGGCYKWLSCHFGAGGPDSNWHKPPPGHPDFKSHPALTQHHQQRIRGANAEAQWFYIMARKQPESIIEKRLKLGHQRFGRLQMKWIKHPMVRIMVVRQFSFRARRPIRPKDAPPSGSR